MGRVKSMCKSKVSIEKAGYLLYQQVFWDGSKIYLTGDKAGEHKGP